MTGRGDGRRGGDREPVMKMVDWVGRSVALRVALATKVTRCREGEVLVVTGHHQGRLDLRDAADPKRLLRRVPRHLVQLLPQASNGASDDRG